MRSEPSNADQGLAQNVRDLGGVWIEATQIQDWHEYGVFEPERSFPGRGGSVSSYPSGTTEIALRFWQLVRAFRSLDAATIVLFIEGHPVGEKGLRRALRWAADNSVSKEPIADAEFYEAAREVARQFLKDRSPLAVALRKMIGVQGKEAENVFKDVALTVLGYPVYVDSGRRSMPDIVRALNLDEHWKEDPSGTSDLLSGWLSDTNSDRFLSMVERASLDDLRQGRKALNAGPIDETEIPAGSRKFWARTLARHLLLLTKDATFEREVVQL